MSKETGGPAFPSHGSMGEVTHEGMTLRDFFATHAPTASADYRDWHARNVGYQGEADLQAMWAFHYADAMIRARGE